MSASLSYELRCDDCGALNRPGQHPGRDDKYFCTLVGEWQAEVVLCCSCAMIQVSRILHAGCEMTLLAYRPTAVLA